MLLRLAKSSVFGAFLFAGSLSAQTAPDPSQVFIQRLTYAGPGCPTGSVAHNMARDAKAFTLIFSDFSAQVGPGIPLGKAKNSCRVTLDMRFPNGWSYSVFSVDYRGYMALDANVKGLQKSTYYFQATPGLARTMNSTFWGPSFRDYQVRDALPLSDVNWSPCGRTRAMNIDTEISVDNALNLSNSGELTIDSMDGEVRHIYGIQWQRCSLN
jgi:Domain of unknown function (DUF4360)